jgi:YYY domain-containing protein
LPARTLGISPARPLALLAWLPLALLLVGLLLGFPLLALAGVGALALERAWRLWERPGECFALLLAALGCAVVFGTEIVYIRDTFEGWSTRFNTVFKFYYQVWLLWGLLAPFALWWALRAARGRARPVALGGAALTCALLAGALVYPWLTLGALGRGEAIGLNGRTPREQTAAGEASIQWLRAEAAPGSVVLEAADLFNAGDMAVPGTMPNCEGGYNGAGFAGVSAATGLPTILGWEGHQRQWRGGDPAVLDQLQLRCDDVDAIYRSTDANRARELLAKYAVDYVYVGGLEQSLYNSDSLYKFVQLGEIAFQQDEVTIYRVR